MREIKKSEFKKILDNFAETNDLRKAFESVGFQVVNDNLKPCPFCGGEVELYEWTLKDFYYIGCKPCYFWTDRYVDKDFLINMWNSRV